MSLQLFLLGLLIVSTLTGLSVQGIKVLLDERKIAYHANSLAGIISCVLSVAVGIGYVVLNSVAVTSAIVVYIVALVFMSWLCAMVGYDKVVQAISQFKTTDTK